jgi:hypothetical protein
MSVRLEYVVTKRGVIWSAPRTNAIMRDAVNEVEEALANRGVDLVREYYDRSFRNPTGYARSRVHVDRSRSSRSVRDGNPVYGPWLEGVEERNQAGRFKGYASFRQAGSQLRGESQAIATRVLNERAIRRLNNGI